MTIDKGKGFRRNSCDIVFDFIESEIASGKKFPARGEIAAHMGWKNVGGASECLHQLAVKGALSRRVIDWPKPGAGRHRYVFGLNGVEESTERNRRNVQG